MAHIEGYGRDQTLLPALVADTGRGQTWSGSPGAGNVTHDHPFVMWRAGRPDVLCPRRRQRWPRGNGEAAIEASHDEEHAIHAALDHGVSDADLAAMLRDLANILRGKDGYIGARVAEIAAERLSVSDRPG